jgi:hypothetical protein
VFSVFIPAISHRGWDKGGGTGQESSRKLNPTLRVRASSAQGFDEADSGSDDSELRHDGGRSWSFGFVGASGSVPPGSGERKGFREGIAVKKGESPEVSELDILIMRK